MDLDCVASLIGIFFSTVSTTIPLGPQLVDSADTELQTRGTVNMEELHIWRADYKLYMYFRLCGGLVPLTPAWLKGQLYHENLFYFLKTRFSRQRNKLVY